MNTSTIHAPATDGSTIEITGSISGPFIVHRNTFLTSATDGHDAKLLWSVTHQKTGMRFPWSFKTRNGAFSFARDIRLLMDWDSVDATAGAPTSEQVDAIHHAANKHNGLYKR